MPWVAKNWRWKNGAFGLATLATGHMIWWSGYGLNDQTPALCWQIDANSWSMDQKEFEKAIVTSQALTQCPNPIPCWKFIVKDLETSRCFNGTESTATGHDWSAWNLWAPCHLWSKVRQCSILLVVQDNHRHSMNQSICCLVASSNEGNNMFSSSSPNLPWIPPSGWKVSKTCAGCQVILQDLREEET